MKPSVRSGVYSSENGYQEVTNPTLFNENHKRVGDIEANESSTQRTGSPSGEDANSVHASKRSRSTTDTHPHNEKETASVALVPRSFQVECQIGTCSKVYTHQGRLPKSLLSDSREVLYICPSCRKDFYCMYGNLAHEFIESPSNSPKPTIERPLATSDITGNISSVEIVGSIEDFKSSPAIGSVKTTSCRVLSTPPASPLTEPPSTPRGDNETTDNQSVENSESEIFDKTQHPLGVNPSQDLRFTGENAAEAIKSMMFKIEDAISEYVSHVDHNLKNCQPILKCLYQPLRAAGYVDEHRRSIHGKAWYNLEHHGISQEPGSHTSVTWALRAMVRQPEAEKLVLNRECKSCRDLSFGPVFKGFIYWFVFDVLQDKFDILGLPHLRVMKSVLAAVRNAGAERFGHVDKLMLLREVQLRTSIKSDFEQELHRCDDMFVEALSTFLDPMIIKIKQATPITPDAELVSKQSAAHLKRIVSHTLSLWWYLGSLHCTITWIEPVIGTVSNSNLHECFNSKGGEHEKIQKEKSIRWVLSRGFRFCTTEGDEASAVVIRARVVT